MVFDCFFIYLLCILVKNYRIIVVQYLNIFFLGSLQSMGKKIYRGRLLQFYVLGIVEFYSGMQKIYKEK